MAQKWGRFSATALTEIWGEEVVKERQGKSVRPPICDYFCGAG